MSASTASVPRKRGSSGANDGVSLMRTSPTRVRSCGDARPALCRANSRLKSPEYVKRSHTLASSACICATRSAGMAPSEVEHALELHVYARHDHDGDASLDHGLLDVSPPVARNDRAEDGALQHVDKVARVAADEHTAIGRLPQDGLDVAARIVLLAARRDTRVCARAVVGPHLLPQAHREARWLPQRIAEKGEEDLARLADARQERRRLHEGAALVDGQQHILARQEALLRAVHSFPVGLAALILWVVLVPALPRRDGRVVRRMALRAAPVGYQDRLPDVKRRQACAFVVWEAEDVIGAVRAVEEWVASAHVADRLAYHVRRAVGARQPVELPIAADWQRVVPGRRPREAREPAARPDRHVIEVGHGRVIRA
eukprot:2122665-Prymnesium_polylepis.1